MRFPFSETIALENFNGGKYAIPLSLPESLEDLHHRNEFHSVNLPPKIRQTGSHKLQLIEPVVGQTTAHTFCLPNELTRTRVGIFRPCRTCFFLPKS